MRGERESRAINRDGFEEAFVLRFFSIVQECFGECFLLESVVML